MGWGGMDALAHSFDASLPEVHLQLRIYFMLRDFKCICLA